MYNSNASLAEMTAQLIMERTCQTSGFISYTEARKIYGRWFTELVKLGEIRPIHKGQGRNGTARFLKSDILAKIDDAKRQAYADMFNN